MSSHRPYQLKARAERRAKTRERIIAATEALHGEVGPARTTIADVARRADVERLTVYNHFPDLRDLLAACQARFLHGHPPPDLSPGNVSRAGASDRLEGALADLYRWYRANEAIEGYVHRDRLLVPELDDLLRQSSDRMFASTAEAYAALFTRSARRGAGVRSLVRVALDFGTWKLLAAGGLSDIEAARVMTSAILNIR